MTPATSGKRTGILKSPGATLVYPHQLFRESPALSKTRPVVLVEDPWFFRRHRFHVQKLMLHRAGMQAYRDYLEQEGYEVVYIESAEIPTTADIFVRLSKEGKREVHFCDPLEHGLGKEIHAACTTHGIRPVAYESPMFLCDREYLYRFYEDSRRFHLTEFYVAQRKRLNILLDGNGKPVGKRWTFDTLNREPLPGDIPIPKVWRPEWNEYVKNAAVYVREQYPGAPGDPDDFSWPVTFDDSHRWFLDFLAYRLALFGRYEDAIHRSEAFLFHSAISPLLNCGLLTPAGVVDATLEYAESHEIPIESLEGFIRQVIGWREFVRAVYLIAGEREQASNVLGLSHRVPPCFWTAATGIEPVDAVIRRVHDHAYCHHIERLMVLGNIMLLAEFHPDQVYTWFSEFFIDAYDWVMVPNVYGMSQFADGGMMSSKPYVSGSRYILRMSNFKKGPWCDLWDALYWRFLYVHRDIFAHNPRMAPFIAYITRMPEERRSALIDRAGVYLASIGACAVTPQLSSQ
ncbi:MAG: Deoxyribodipyrimidine photo-lyase-related protein [Methanoregulaceae archaeon PtaB.Bin056]|nr:MAG: Deoxyribodipyrimidine photo-lyase-related protein [Methanoregulaceae archaeon PtaB.Bin056]